MKILVLGGTSFFGKNLVNQLIKNGHSVTIGTRGIAKDNFGNSVKRVKLNRDDEESMREAIVENYDIVYDNIMYSSNNARAIYNVIKDKTKKYIFISSVAVYDNALENLKEEDFDPYRHNVVFGDFKKEFTYSEGKQNGEAFIFQQEGFKAIGVRFPIVVGSNDNTGRIQWYIETIKNGRPFSVADLEAKLVLISSEEAGEILALLGEKDFEGPINITSEGYLTIKEFIKLIESATNGKANIVPIEDNVEQSPYDKYSKLTTDNSRINSFGYKFKNINDVVNETVSEYLNGK